MMAMVLDASIATRAPDVTTAMVVAVAVTDVVVATTIARIVAAMVVPRVTSLVSPTVEAVVAETTGAATTVTPAGKSSLPHRFHPARCPVWLRVDGRINHWLILPWLTCFRFPFCIARAFTALNQR